MSIVNYIMFVLSTSVCHIDKSSEAVQTGRMTIDARYMAFGEAVALRREQLKMTQAALALQVGLSRASIANIERGRQNVLLHHACNIAAALGLSSVGDLLPVEAIPSLEDRSLALSESVSAKAKAQISGLIASAMATTKARS